MRRYEYTPPVQPESPEGNDRLILTVASGVLALGLVGVVAGFKIGRDVFAIPRFAEAIKDCPTLDRAEIQRRTKIILTAANHENDARLSWQENEARLAQLRAEHNVKFVDTDAIVDTVNTLNRTDKIAAFTDRFTRTHFGFTTSVRVDPHNPEQTRTDASQLLRILDTTPADLPKSAGLDSVTLGDAKLGREANYHGTTGGESRSKPNDDKSQTIVIPPGRVWEALPHEFGHHAQWGAATKACGNPYVPDFYDPDFTAANPPDFRYGYPPKHWKGVTLDWYGATAVAEDEADNYDILLMPDRGCKAAQSDTIAEKMSVVSMHLDALRPEVGEYAIRAFTHYCTTYVQ